MVPNDILSKVTLEGDERGGINWGEDVEMTYPSTDLAEDYLCDLGKLKRKSGGTWSWRESDCSSLRNLHELRVELD